MNNLLERLNMENISPLFDEYYENLAHDTHIPNWLTEDFVISTQEECGLLPTQLEVVLDALREVVKNKDLVLFAKILYEMLKIKKHYDDVFYNLTLPKAPEGENPIAYDMVSFFPMLAHHKYTYLNLRKKGVDENILKNTFGILNGCIAGSIRRTQKPELTIMFFSWASIAKNERLFRIGRFNLEILKNPKLNIRAFKDNENNVRVLADSGVIVHKDGYILGTPKAENKEDSFETHFCETDTYYEGYEAESLTATIGNQKVKLDKNTWKPFYTPGDDVINVHIPNDESFDIETIEKSLEEGKSFFKKYFPEVSPSAFYCYSWLLAPELASFLKPSSNIIGFQNKFSKCPVRCPGIDVFYYVFKEPYRKLEEYDLNNLPEDNSLRKKIKDHYLSGKIVHESGGIFPFK